MEITRKNTNELLQRVNEKVKFIQILAGPRQVGKTTAVKQIEKSVNFPCLYFSADSNYLNELAWVETAWLQGRALLNENKKALLILDEVQQIENWQQKVKELWDNDRLEKRELHVIITGSSALLLKKGTESLAGRFEKLEMLQWSFSEMKEAFDYSLEDFILMGGYPASAIFKQDEQRWKSYIQESLIETIVTKDILALKRVNKPSLLRQFFFLICSYPAQIVALNNFLGQLQDAGNVTTLSEYAELLKSAFLIECLFKWSGSNISTKNSKIKWIINDNAFISAQNSLDFNSIKNSNIYGNFVENAVISHLNKLLKNNFYWRERNLEVDLVSLHNSKLYSMEIKSGNRIRSKNGLQKFKEKYPEAISVIIGASGISIEEVLTAETFKW